MVNELNGKCEVCHIDLYFLFSFIPVTRVAGMFSFFHYRAIELPAHGCPLFGASSPNSLIVVTMMAFI